MCEFLKFRKLKSQLRSYEKQKEAAYTQLERVADSFECGRCDHYNNGNVKTYAERFEACDCKRKDILVSLAVRADQAQAEARNFLENKYAFEVFKHYSDLQPELTNNSTGETVSWKEAFGEDFDSIPKTLRHSLVGLVEKTGRYKVK